MNKMLEFAMVMLVRFAPKLFVRERFEIKAADIENLHRGNIVIWHNHQYNGSEVRVLLSDVKSRRILDTDRELARFFYYARLGIGGPGPSHYPRPEHCYTADGGMEPYRNGGSLNSTNRSYLVPLKVPENICKILIDTAVSNWKGLVMRDTVLGGSESPFVSAE